MIENMKYHGSYRTGEKVGPTRHVFIMKTGTFVVVKLFKNEKNASLHTIKFWKGSSILNTAQFWKTNTEYSAHNDVVGYCFQLINDLALELQSPEYSVNKY